MNQTSNATFEMAPDRIDYEGTVSLRTKTKGFFRRREEWLLCDFKLSGNMLHYRASELPRTTHNQQWGIIYLDDVLELLPTVNMKARPSPECRMKIRGKTDKAKWKIVFCTASPGELAAWMKHLSNGCNPYHRQQEPSAAENIEEEVEVGEAAEEDYYYECAEDETAVDDDEPVQLQPILLPSNSKPREPKDKVLKWLLPESPPAVDEDNEIEDNYEVEGESEVDEGYEIEDLTKADVAGATEDDGEIEDGCDSCHSLDEILRRFDFPRTSLDDNDYGSDYSLEALRVRYDFLQEEGPESNDLDGERATETTDHPAVPAAANNYDDINALLSYVANKMPEVDHLDIQRITKPDSSSELVVMATAGDLDEDHPAVQRYLYDVSSPSSVVRARPRRQHAVSDLSKAGEIEQSFGEQQRYSYSKRKIFNDPSIKQPAMQSSQRQGAFGRHN